MSLKGRTVGELCDPRGTFSVEWKIPNYFSMPQRADTYMDSPMFQFSKSNWFLRIYPNGERTEKTVEWFELFLCLKNPEDSMYCLTFNLGIKDFDEKLINFGSNTWVYNAVDRAYGWGLMKRAELLRLKHKYARQGALTLCCAGKLSSVTDTSSQTMLLDSTNILSCDFQNLFLSEQKSDVILKVGGRVFRAHKLILETRSPVFAAMFQHNMAENNNGIVNISDCGPDTFHDFLLFVYTGKLENLSTDNVVGLYTIADKYDLKELKEKCTNFMKDNLSVDTVCDVMSVAERHNETELRDSAKQLLVRNIKTILPTENWKEFYRENPVVAVELLMTIIPGAS